MEEKKIYEGSIVREWYSIANDCDMIQEPKLKIYVKILDGLDFARFLIYAIYRKNEGNWTPNRTSVKFPDDKIFIRNVRVVDEKSIDGAVHEF